jgi:hypothetical protein
MRQRGRKSGAGLGILQVDGKPNRLNPPPSLSAAERAIFFDVVAACDRDHFRPIFRCWFAMSRLPRLAIRQQSNCGLGR